MDKHTIACVRACRDLTEEGLERAAEQGVVEMLYGPKSNLGLTLKVACADAGCEYPEILHPADVIEKHIMRTMLDCQDKLLEACKRARGNIRDDYGQAEQGELGACDEYDVIMPLLDEAIASAAPRIPAEWLKGGEAIPRATAPTNPPENTKCPGCGLIWSAEAIAYFEAKQRYEPPYVCADCRENERQAWSRETQS